MYRNIYDTDVTTWSQQGRIHQVEYAMESVKQGTCCLGIRSDSHVVIAGIRRSFSPLSSYSQKIMKVDSHIGVTFSGITTDSKYLVDIMRKECLAYNFLYNSVHPIKDLVEKIGLISQANTQIYSKRPYGCGLIVGGIDKDGPHLYETCPSGNFTEYYAITVGSRSQSAKTYLENHYKIFPQMSVDDLVYHALSALKKSITDEQQLTNENVSIGIIFPNDGWKELSNAECSEYLSKL